MVQRPPLSPLLAIGLLNARLELRSKPIAGMDRDRFEDELRDQEHMLEQLRARRFHAAEGLPAGELRPYLEEPVKA